MTNKVALVFHMNLDHANLSRAESLSMIQGGLEEMLQSTKVPINISSTARDWELIKELNPEFLEWIKSNDLITILDGIYSHSISTHFPEFVDIQFDLGHRTHQQMFGESSSAKKLSPYGLVPEFAFDTSILGVVYRYWKGTFANATSSKITRVYSEDYQGTRENLDNCEDVDVINVFDVEGNIFPVNVAKRDKLNTILNKLFRGLNEPKHFIIRLKQALQATSAPFVAYINDLETPLINKSIYGGQRIVRYDMWDVFMRHLPLSGIEFIALDESAIASIRDYADTLSDRHVILPRGKKKWLEMTNTYDLYLDIKKVSEGININDTYQLKGLLVAMSSDAFVVLSCADKKITPVTGRIRGDDGKYVAVPSIFNEYDSMRYLEATHILSCLRRGVPVNHGTTHYPKAQQTYFDGLHSILSR
ncbi:hypothetical protein HYX00_00300 [Candidatus Woesearchaeota archaeon]|nr:hypothetical protein [Candidatus Woesearchaeota archaeon]